MNNIIKKLFQLQDKKYKEFQIKLIPTINPNNIIGIYTKELRKYAKELVKDNNYISFIEELPHKYFEENQLHAFIISEIKDYNKCIEYINKFLPYINNWATCDQMSPKIFKKYKEELIKEINIWINTKEEYTIRFGICMLMRYYLDEEFKKEYLDKVCNIKKEEYYVNMMRAWFFATALVKQYKDTIPYIENNKLDTWTHNKTIQKARESYRITKDIKEYLKGLKRK
ncbi:MAG: DNA alkylation repair protein [Bacilli bacterium]|nr:DNA alkylation repair protein [Bacilli bacterium]